MNILAVDQASGVSGYAWGTPELGCLSCGIIDSRSRFVDLGGQSLKFERRLRELIVQSKAECVAFEAHRAHSGIQAAQLLGAWSLSVMRLAREAGLPYLGIEVGAWKAAFTGTGRASKDLVMAVARKKYPGLPITRYDVADAIGILHGTFAQI